MDSFKKTILDFNSQLTPAAIDCRRLDKIKKGAYDAIIITGMGGSGQVGNLIAGLADELGIKIPVIVWKDYGLPSTNFKKPLCVFISFSGNTEETIDGFKRAKGAKAVVCAGGNLKKLANNDALALIPADRLAPRQAIGYLFYGAMEIIKTALPNVKSPKIKINASALEKTGKKIALRIKNKIVLIYSSTQNSHLAYIWKTLLNETSKSLAFSNTFPEMAHNEITSLEYKPKNITVIFLRDKNDCARDNKKMDVVAKLLKKQKITLISINLNGKNQLEKNWNSVVLALWTSYHLAKIKKVDPYKTQLIDKIKKLMK